MRDSQQRGRLRLRHLREVNEATAEEMEAQRGRFARLADPASAPRVVSSFNLFQTPPDLAARLVEMAELNGGRLLEPSAGLGRIYRAVREVSDCPVTLVEISPDCCRELYGMTESGSATLVQADFLTCTTERIGTFDRIVMNPPFKMGRDIKHIEHARKFLNPGGRLVSLCAAGARQRRHFLDNGHADDWIDLPAGTFKGEGTNVAAAIVVIQN